MKRRSDRRQFLKTATLATAGASMLGAPAVPHTQFKRVNAALHRLPDLAGKLRELEEQLAEMRGRLDSVK